MKKFLSLCLAALLTAVSASAVLADDGIMLISAEPETTAAAVEVEIPDNIVIDDVNAPKTAPLANITYNRNGTVASIGPMPTQVTINVTAGENGSVDVPAKFYAVATSTRTFNITADEGYKVADITVNGESYGPAKSVTLKNIQVAMDIVVTFEEDYIITPVYTETFDAETKWVSGGTAEAAVAGEGTISVKSIGGDPNINMPEALNLPCDDIDEIVVKYTNNTENTSFQIFFTNEANPGYSEAGSFKAECAAGENEIVIKTEGNELWTGTLANMRIDLSNGEGEFIVDEITFNNVAVNTPVVVVVE